MWTQGAIRFPRRCWVGLGDETYSTGVTLLQGVVQDARGMILLDWISLTLYTRLMTPRLEIVWSLYPDHNGLTRFVGHLHRQGRTRGIRHDAAFFSYAKNDRDFAAVQQTGSGSCVLTTLARIRRPNFFSPRHTRVQTRNPAQVPKILIFSFLFDEVPVTLHAEVSGVAPRVKKQPPHTSSPTCSTSTEDASAPSPCVTLAFAQ